MNILIIGGYSFTGIKIAEKFFSEENSITIVDPRKQRKKDLEIKHDHFDIKSDDRRLSRIFESKKFDVVVFLPEDKKDIRSVSNILEFCTKNNVLKFISTTSMEIYDSLSGESVDERLKLEPRSPISMSEFVREYYCLKWGESNGLKVVMVRHPVIYGPKEELSEKPSLVFNLVKSLLSKKRLSIKGVTADDVYDYIYVDDFSEAIYMLATDEGIKGVFNVSSSKGHSVKEVVDIFRDNKGFIAPRIQNKGASAGNNLVLDNKKIMLNIKWKPLTTLKEGIHKTLKYYLALTNSKKKLKEFLKKEKPRPKKKRKLTAVAYLENIILFLIIAFIQYSEPLFGIKLFDLKIDYAIVYIIIMGILWGQTQAYIAIILSSALYIGINLYTGTDIVTFLYIPENLLRLAVYVLVGILTGYAIDRKNRDIEAKEVNISSLRNKYNFLLDIYNQTRVIKNELENQIIDSKDSFGAVYSIIQQLESLEIEKIFSSSIFALEKILKTDMVSIYTTNSDGTNNYMRLKARSLALEGKVPNSIKISGFKEINEIFETKKIYINRKLDDNLPVMMAPILDRGKVIAIVSIHKIEFENLTMHYENLFQTVIGLITNTLKRAYIFEASLKDKRYIDKTRVLTADTFESVLEEIRNNKEELGMSYSLLKVTNSDLDLDVLNDKIVEVVRDNDYIGMDKSDNLYILLSNTKENYAGIVIERLEKKGIFTDLAKDDIDF